MTIEDAARPVNGYEVVVSGACPTCDPVAFGPFRDLPPFPASADSARGTPDRRCAVMLAGRRMSTATAAVAGDPGWVRAVTLEDPDPEEARFRDRPDPRRIAVCRLHGQIRSDILRGPVVIEVDAYPSATAEPAPVEGG